MSSCGERSSLFALAEFPLMAKSEGWANRNPENPDSDKGAQSPPTTFAAVWIPAFAGMTGLESGNDGLESGIGEIPAYGEKRNLDESKS